MICDVFLLYFSPSEPLVQMCLEVWREICGLWMDLEFKKKKKKNALRCAHRLFTWLDFPPFLTCKHAACKCENEWVRELSPLSLPLSLSFSVCVRLCASPESGASERSGRKKNQSGAMRQAAPQLANHRFEHQKRGGAVGLPASLSKQPSFLACRHSPAPLFTSLPTSAHFPCSRSCAPPLRPPPARLLLQDHLSSSSSSSSCSSPTSSDQPHPSDFFDFFFLETVFFPLVFIWFFFLSWICRRGAQTRGSSTFDGKQEVWPLLTWKVRSRFTLSHLCTPFYFIVFFSLFSPLLVTPKPLMKKRRIFHLFLSNLKWAGVLFSGQMSKNIFDLCGVYVHPWDELNDAFLSPFHLKQAFLTVWVFFHLLKWLQSSHKPLLFFLFFTVLNCVTHIESYGREVEDSTKVKPSSCWPSFFFGLMQSCCLVCLVASVIVLINSFQVQGRPLRRRTGGVGASALWFFRLLKVPGF